MKNLDDIIFPPSFDLLIYQAKAEFFNYGYSVDFSTDELHLEEIRQGLSMLLPFVKETLTFLNGPDTLELAAGMEEELRSPFFTLDVAVMVGEYIISSTTYPENIQSAAANIASLPTVTYPLPCHRFIPLNEWRRHVRADLPGDLAFMLPWYDIWTDVDDYLIQELITVLPALERGDYSTFLREEQTMIQHLYQEIRADEPFLHALQQKNAILLQTVEAVGSDPVIRLFFLAEASEPIVTLTSNILSKGFYHTAVQVAGSKTTTEEQRHEKILVAAFAGPELEDEQRMDLFRRVVSFIEKNENTFPERSLLAKIALWLRGKQDDSISEEIFIRWLELLAKAAPQVTTTCEDGAFSNAVKYLITSPLDPDPTPEPSWLETMGQDIRTTIEAIVQMTATMTRSLTIQAVPAYMMDEEDEEPTPEPVEGISGPRLRHAPLPDDGRLFAGDEAKDIRPLANDYRLYCAIVKISPDGKRSMETSRFTGSRKVSIEENPAIVAAIGADMAILKKMATEIVESGTIDPENAEKVIWFIYHSSK